MNSTYSYIEAIKSRMSAEDVRFYKDIWAPVEVASPDSDAWTNLCVMPDGEIRCYGVYLQENVFQTNVPRCYLASTDGGLSWKRHMVNGRFTLGASVYVPYLNKYVAIRDFGAEGSFVLLGDSPDDENPMRILVAHGSIGEVRMIFPMRSRERVIVVAHEKRPELHPTAFFAVLYVADGDLREWRRIPLEAAPFYTPASGKKGMRWQQNNRENSIEELSDGRLVMISRTATDYHYVSYSADGGDTWTKPEQSIFHSTGTMPNLKRLSDGRLLFTWCNTRLMPEREDADGIWEDVFTNRDANHAAISEDEGESWIGFREMALNPLRNDADFRSVGGPERGRDKSVHQIQTLELPDGKVLVHYGQNFLSRLIIFDLKWLYETERREDFLHGLRDISSQGYVHSIMGCYRGTPETALEHVGHCAYNRVNSVCMIPDPLREGREAMQICRSSDPRLVNGIGGAVWNFPAAKRGTVKIKFLVDGEGIRVSLLDHWVNPTDEEVRLVADFTGVITAAAQRSRDSYTELRLLFDCEANTVAVYADNRFLSQVTMKHAHPHGLCYLHLQSAAAGSDPRGTLIAGMEFEATEE